MRPPAIACLYLSCVFLLSLTREAIANSDYVWPLPLERALSSTFGETRPPGKAPPAAFHAGIDLKTWGKNGYEVRALADGHIMRLRTSPWGYGRVIYQRLRDGRIAVYAHLEAFAQPMAARVEESQQQSQRYTTDLWLEPDEVVIERGQVIAWTGKSGAGPPHLHLELRNSDNVPINPLTHSFQVRDTTPPTIRSIAFVPLGSHSTVDGNHDPVTVDLRWDGKRGLYLSGSRIPVVSGAIGIAVRGHDRADLADNRLAPYRNDLLVDGELILSAIYEQVPYSDAFQANMDRMRLGTGTYATLYRLPGNRLGFYRTASSGPTAGTGLSHQGVLLCGETAIGESAPDGATRLDKGQHKVEVVSLDASGNSRSARVSFIVDAPPRIVSTRVVREKDGAFLEAELSDADDDLLKVTLALAEAGGGWKTVSAQTLVASSGPFTWPLPDSGRMARLSVEDSVGAGTFRTHSTATPKASPKRGAEQPNLTIQQSHFHDYVEFRIEADEFLTAPPALLWHSFAAAKGELRQVGLKEYRAVIRFEPAAAFRASGPMLGAAPVDADELDIAIEARGAETGARLFQTAALNATPVDAASAAVISFHQGATRLSFPQGSVYQTIYPQSEQIRLRTATTDDPGNDLDSAYRFGPTGVTFNHKVSISIRIPDEVDDPEKMAVYVDHSGEGKWAFTGRELEVDEVGRYVSASVRSFGRQYALRADRRAPEISKLRPADGAVVRADQGLHLSASIRDEDSGIGLEEDIAMLLDGQRLISVYDPDADLVEFRSKARQQPGVYELVVKVRDQCGNEATKISSFTIK